MLPAWNRFAALLLLGLLVTAIGCGPKPEPSGTLVGTVKSGGELCNNCNVSVASTNSHFRRGVRVDDSGGFEIKGLPFGDYRVNVGQRPTNDDTNTFDKRIPEKFRRAETSGLTATISSEEPVTLNIEM